MTHPGITRRQGLAGAVMAPLEDAIRRAYDECLLVRPWEQGDLVVVDNLKVSHGRKPYSGDRRVLVAMAGTTAVDA